MPASAPASTPGPDRAPGSDPGDGAAFTLAYVPGVTPGKWVRTWNERMPHVPLTLTRVPAADATTVARGHAADAVLLRLSADRAGLHAIPLYAETTVAVVPKDHLVTAADEVTIADLVDDVVLHPLDDTLDWDAPPGRPAIERPDTTGDAVTLVAAGVGILVVPQSLARLHHRRDLTYRPVVDAPRSRVALAWPEGDTTELMEQFIGIVRGRTVNSTRGRPPAAPAERGGESSGKRAPKGTGKRAAHARSSGNTRRATDRRGSRRKPRRRS